VARTPDVVDISRAEIAMIARFTAVLPFTISLPEGAAYTLTSYEDSGMTVIVYPPSIVPDEPLPPGLPTVRIDDQPALHANGLRIDFHKATFDRQAGQPLSDPPLPVVMRSVNSFLQRFRYVTRAQQVHELPEHSFQWTIRYLNDDESELQPQEGLIRGAFARTIRFSVAALSPATWDQVHSLPPDFDPPVWSVLHLDASAALPHIGTGIVLAAAALEVFIAQVLDRVVGRTTVPTTLWEWIQDRGNYQKEPSVSEQYDVLLKCLIGHSLKEDQPLWEAFKNLRDARNSFAHAGIAKIGNKVVDLQRATQLIVQAREIIELVLGWVPADLQWPTFAPTTKLEVSSPVFDAGPHRSQLLPAPVADRRTDTQ
jgi:hypothetical protein